MLEVRPVTGIGEVTPGTDLADLITTAAPWLEDGDVLVVTSKIVSKSEGRLVEVPAEDGPERDAARDVAIAAETARVVARRGPTRIVQTHHGLVMAAAGIDASNVERSRLVLLPVDPDASARALRAALRERHGRQVGVVITDTMGRPWRLGLTDVAIGAAGVLPVRDYRGDVDPYGNELHVTEVADIDELAGAGELVKGKFDQVPIAVIRGYGGVTDDDGPGARALVRDAEMDMFSLGTAEARALGRSEVATLADATEFAHAPVDPDLVAAALEAVSARSERSEPRSREQVDTVGAAFTHVTDAGVRDKLRDLAPSGTAELVVVHVPADADRWTVAEVGATVHRLRAALASADLSSAWVRADAATITDLATLPAGHEPLGLLAIGAPAKRQM
ncbi:coenzyme F420-0:L-glutamate ligase [Planosporangium flavigriseum]|uniref:Coenzyme F420:L-glutamate ligase n=1 Tax=Planosporangium flavigriseum TaxID=373681 RepID=A0A8J3LLF6_9ACTN|nr:coenzyme F420-0:L-glutamate ligase [Planosporangium flavigriseum]NJC64925.1 coenzyme F420-0:L-glutamate ligase [Planosporangium flavigriseum]GIG72800.1 coenzyme F420:L-glutamate ligase [Planosporangium flavigriseum]